MSYTKRARNMYSPRCTSCYHLFRFEGNTFLFFFLIRKHASLSQTDIRTRLNPNTLSATLRHQGNLMQTQTILVGTTRFSGCTRVLFSMFLLHPIFNFLFILNVHDNMIWLKDNI